MARTVWLSIGAYLDAGRTVWTAIGAFVSPSPVPPPGQVISRFRLAEEVGEEPTDEWLVQRHKQIGLANPPVTGFSRHRLLAIAEGEPEQDFQPRRRFAAPAVSTKKLRPYLSINV
jgi:hypothetical protein